MDITEYAPEVSSTSLGTRSGFDTGTSFSTLGPPNPYTSYQESPFTELQPTHTDLLHLGINHTDWKSNAPFPSSELFVSADQTHLQSQKHLPTSLKTPNYQNFFGSQSFAETTFSLLPRPPPYQSDDYRSPQGTSSYLGQNGGQSSGHDYWEKQQTKANSEHVIQQRNIPERNTALQQPKKEPIMRGLRSAVDRKHMCEQLKSVTGNKLSQPNHGSTVLPWSLNLEMALIELYPQCNSYLDCIENLIHDYNINMSKQVSKNFSHIDRLDIPNIDQKSSSEKSGQIGKIPIRTKPSLNMATPELFDTTLDNNSDSSAESEIYQDPEVSYLSSATISGQESAQFRSMNLHAASPRADQQHPTEIGTKLRFACPFHQRDPEKYHSYRACTGPGWESVHRTKEHVYRNHKLPIMCRRCSKAFKTDSDLQRHSQSLISCEVRTSDQEGCNQDQEKKLRLRPKPGKTEVDKWDEMYRILFPNDRHLPLPFYEVRGQCCRIALERFKEYVIAELPKGIDEDIGTKIAIRIGKTKSRLKQFICDRTEELLEKFIDMQLKRPSKLRSSSNRLRSSSQGSLGIHSVPVDRGSGLSPNAFPRSNHHTAKKPRRRASSELSSSQSSDHIAKRLATGMTDL